MANANIIWNYFQSKGLNEYGIAGLMGNLYAESGLMPNNLQNTGNKKFGITDDMYVIIVDTDDRTYSCEYNSKKYYGREAFIYDRQGFGIAQWTFWSRKKDFLEFARAVGKSIGDLDMQLDFLWKELSESYKSVLQTLKTATSVLEASNAVLLKFERPADQSEDVQKKRAGFGQVYYDQFAQSKEVDLNEFAKLFGEMRKTLQDNDCSAYSANARQWAIQLGLIAGNGTTIGGEPNCMWQDFLTREQFVTVLYRFFQLAKEAK